MPRQHARRGGRSAGRTGRLPWQLDAERGFDIGAGDATGTQNAQFRARAIDNRRFNPNRAGAGVEDRVDPA